MKMDKSSTVSCQVDILRHGECEGGHIFRGSTDVPLSNQGLAQMREATAGRQWDQIYSSPLMRCQAFADNLSYQQRIALSVVEPLKEMSFGLWDGKLVDEVMVQDAERLAVWRQDPVAHPPPGGEPIVAVAERARNVLDMLRKHGVGKRTLVVTHGGFIRVLLCEVLQAPLRSAHSWQVPFASLISLYGFQLGDQWRWQIDLRHQAPQI